MKLLSKFALVMASSSLFAVGCAKTAEQPAPVAPAKAEVAKVEQPQANPTPTAAPAGGAAPAEVAEVAAAAPHEGCGAHGEKAAAGDQNCPFHDPNAKAPGQAMGCGDHAVTEPSKTAEGKLHFGSTFAITDAKPLGEVVSSATDGQELTVRVNGKIEKVCKKKGCWMVVKDGDVEARVVMKDYAFTVPLDSAGRTTSVEGVLKVRVFTEAQAKHLAEDGGEDPSKVVGEKKEMTLTATAVEIGG
jgi:hypothetical protein